MNITVTKEAEVPEGDFCEYPNGQMCKQERTRIETASRADFGGLSDGSISFYECRLFNVLLDQTDWQKDVGFKIIKCKQCKAACANEERNAKKSVS